METTLQLTIDCADPQRLVAFWAEALGYVPEPPPGGHATWREYWADLGVPEEELASGAGEAPESIVDPAGRGPADVTRDRPAVGGSREHKQSRTWPSQQARSFTAE